MEGGWKFFTPPDQGDSVHCLCLCPSPEHNRAHLDMGGFAYTAPSPLFFEGIREKWLDAGEYPESMNASWNFIPRWIDNRGEGGDCVIENSLITFLERKISLDLSLEDWSECRGEFVV